MLVAVPQIRLVERYIIAIGGEASFPAISMTCPPVAAASRHIS
jgi:hypothetical protein